MLRECRSCVESAGGVDEHGDKAEKTDEMEKLRRPLSTLELFLRLVSSIEDYGSGTWVDSWRRAERRHGWLTSNTAAQKRDI